MNVNEQAQIQLPALSLKELIQPSAMTALDQPFVFLAVIRRLAGESLPKNPALPTYQSSREGPYPR